MFQMSFFCRTTKTQHSRGMLMLVGIDPVHATSSGVRTSISNVSNLYFRSTISSYVARSLASMQVLMNGFSKQGSPSARHASGPAIRRAVIKMSSDLAMPDVLEERYKLQLGSEDILRLDFICIEVYTSVYSSRKICTFSSALPLLVTRKLRMIGMFSFKGLLLYRT